MPNPRTPYWFYAKKYGWGWGLPARWEGWVVLIVWLAIVVAAAPIIALRSFPLFYVFIAVMCVIIFAICYSKGEPPRWRWGK